jgi:cobalt-zinc-cadmium resistance protein CzcA
MIAVPLPLFLIFILLYFAFGSIKEALMVYSDTIICSWRRIFLWMRGLPLAFSAGVGFTVWYRSSNGIVLIEHFKN